MVRRKHAPTKFMFWLSSYLWIKDRYVYMYDLYYCRLYQYMLYLKPINLNGLDHIMVFSFTLH